MDVTPIKKLYVDLDSLLDTRMGTIIGIDEASVILALNNGYRDRKIDDFNRLTAGRIDNEQFRLEYRQRDKETLKRSRVTPIVELIYEISKEVTAQKIDTPFIEHFKVVINIYPYVLDDEEKDFLKTLVMNYTTFDTEIEVIREPVENLTPSLIKKHWGGVIMYDFDGWFTIHSKEMDTLLMPRVSMFVPALYVKEPESDEVLEEEGLEGMTHFNIFEMSLLERVSLEMLKARQFSVIEL